MTQEQQIKRQADTLYSDAVAQYFKVYGLDVRKCPYLQREIRMQCRVQAVSILSLQQGLPSLQDIKVLQKDMRMGQLSHIRDINNILKDSGGASHSAEMKTLTQMVARLQKSVESSATATAAPQSWKGYIKSPLGVTSMVLGGLLLLNLIF